MGGLFLSFLGFIFFLMGFFGRRKAKKRLKNYPFTVAIIGGYETNHTTDGILFHPKLFFTTRDGKNISAASTYGSSLQPYRQGDQVQIIYNPQNPYEAELLKDASRTTLHLIFMIFGGGFMFSGIFIAIIEFIFIGI